MVSNNLLRREMIRGIGSAMLRNVSMLLLVVVMLLLIVVGWIHIGCVSVWINPSASVPVDGCDSGKIVGHPRNGDNDAGRHGLGVIDVLASHGVGWTSCVNVVRSHLMSQMMTRRV